MGDDEVAHDFGYELARYLDLIYPSRATKEQYDRMIAEDRGSHSKTAANIPATAFSRCQIMKSAADRNPLTLSTLNPVRGCQLYSRHSLSAGL
jgi:hypothetical protein